MLRVDHRQWDQTVADLRHLALTAAHPRRRERFLALHEIARGRCATAVAERTGRRAQTVMGWLHAYNEHDPEALTYQRSGGRPPLSGYRRRAWRAGSCRATLGSLPASRRSRCKAALDAAGSGWLGARTVWPPLLPRDHPPRPAPAQVVVEEGPKLLGRGDPEPRQAFVTQIDPLLDGARDEHHHLVYLDEAHIHQDVDLGHGWGECGERFQVASSSPGLKAKVSFYGLYLDNEEQARIWPYDRASGGHTIDVPRR